MVFVPVKRNQFSWKTSLFGSTSRLVASVCLKYFCVFLVEHQYRLPYTLPVSRKLANAIFKIADLPIVPFSDAEKIKPSNIVKPTACQVQESVAARYIPDTEAARKNAYLPKISLSHTTSEMEQKL